MELTSRIKRYIEQYENIHIAFSQERMEDSFPAALALFYSLKDLGKNATLLNQSWPEKYNFLVQEDKMSSYQADFLIAVKEQRVKVTELSYEKTNRGTNIFLKTKGVLKPENIVCQPVFKEALLIAIGVQGLKEIESLLLSKSYLALNFDNSKDNEGFGQVNLNDPSKSSVSEMVFEMIKEMFGISDPYVFLCLGTGIISQAVEGKEKLQETTLLKLKELKNKNVDFDLIANLIFPESASKKLFVKVMGLLEENPQGTAFVSLQAKDFKTTGSFPSNLAFSLEKAQFFPFKDLVFLWEQSFSPLLVRGVFYSQEPKRREVLANAFSSQQKGKAILFSTGFPQVKEARDKIYQMLKNI